MSRLILDTPFYFTVACFFFALLIAFFLYYRLDKNKEITTRIRWFLFALRFVFIFLISFFLLEPLIKHATIEKERPILVLAVDNSQSMVTSKDSLDVKNNLLTQLPDFKSRLAEKFDVVTYAFDSRLKQTDSINFSGKETDYSLLFRELESNYSNTNLGAVVLVSDGLLNKGSNPLNKVQQLRFPVYTLATGDTTEQVDLLIKRIDHNKIAYLGNRFPVEVLAEAIKCEGKTCVISISSDGKVLEEKTIPISSPNWMKKVNYVFEAQKPGVRQYKVSLNILEGEKNIYNNTSSFVVEIIDNRDKILILYQSPHPDIAAIRQSIETNKNYEVVVSDINDFSGSLKPYSALVLHGVDVKKFPALKNDFENLSLPCLRLLASNGDWPGIRINGPEGKYNETEPVVQNSFSLFTISPELKSFLKQVPAVRSPLGNYTMGNDVNILIHQQIGIVETELPLLYFMVNSRQKLAVFVGDGIWRWRMQDYALNGNFNLFNELISKTIQYLSVKEDKSFFRVNGRKIFNENEPLQMDAEVYNKSYELITEQDVTMTIRDSSGKAYDYTFSKNENRYLLDGIFFPPGEYKYEAQVKIDGQVMKKNGMFTVRELLAERANTVANHQLLYQLAQQSGGKMFFANQLKQLEEELKNKQDIKVISYERLKFSDFIDLKWIFFLILFFISAEWFLRKRNGLY